MRNMDNSLWFLGAVLCPAVAGAALHDMGRHGKLTGRRGAGGRDRGVWFPAPEEAMLEMRVGCSNSMGIGCVS